MRDMTTKQLISYVHRKTGRELNPPRVSEYIREGRLYCTKVKHRTYFSAAQADHLIEWLTSMDLTNAAEHMSQRIGRAVTTESISKLCKGGIIPYIGNPRRIPCKHLKELEDTLRLQIELLPASIARSVLAQAEEYYPLSELAKKCYVTYHKLWLIKDGKRKGAAGTMNVELYGRIVDIIEERQDEENL